MANDEILIQKLDTLIKLSVLSLIEAKTQKEQILLLSKVGFAPKEIAALIGTTPNTVSVELSGIRKGKKRHVTKKSIKGRAKNERRTQDT